MNTFYSIIMETAQSVLDGLSLSPDEEEQLRTILVKRAMDDSVVRAEFEVELDGKRLLGPSSSSKIVPLDVGITSPILPSMALPVVVRERFKPVKVSATYVVSPAFRTFLQENYAQDALIMFRENRAHDHAHAALSRQIEIEMVSAHLFTFGGDLLRKPVAGYDYSVIDVGADWRRHIERNHDGVHSCSPLLDARDVARDARRSIQIVGIGDPKNAPVCQRKIQDCSVTAPYAMSIHANYDISPEDTCATMLRRGIKIYSGSMLLPAALGNLGAGYYDEHYQYQVTLDTATRGSKVLPPQQRVVAGKYLFRKSQQLVKYSFLRGSSRSYVHDLDNLKKYLTASTYVISDVDGNRVAYQYSIWKRVGSLLYFDFKRVDEEVLPHEVRMESALSEPFDGYVATVDDQLLSSRALIPGTADIHIPRYLFNVVGGYCLTQQAVDNHSIETVLAYVGSVMTRLDFNGTKIHDLSIDSPEDLRVATAIAAYQWSADRFALLKARVPSLASFDRADVGSGILSKLGVNPSFESIKSLVSQHVGGILADQLSSVLMGNMPAVDFIREIAARAKQFGSFGLKQLYDAQDRVGTMRPLVSAYQLHDPAIKVNAKDEFALVQAIYDEPALVIGSPFKSVEGKDQPSLAGTTLVEIQESESDVDFHRVRASIKDYINQSYGSESEARDGALDTFEQVFGKTDRVLDLAETKDYVGSNPMALKFTKGVLINIRTLLDVHVRGTEDFESSLAAIAGKNRFIFPYRVGTTRSMSTFTITLDGRMRMDTKRMVYPEYEFDALHVPFIDVLNADRLKPVIEEVDALGPIQPPETILEDGVAGCGKTESQVKLVVQERDVEVTVDNGGVEFVPILLLANTKSAVAEAIERATSRGIKSVERLIMTVDSFLMNRRKWVHCRTLLLDEVLQMHAGKVWAAIYVSRCEFVRGYGDSKQIRFFSKAKYYAMQTKSDFDWGVRLSIQRTWRLPRCQAIQWLREDGFYGSTFGTNTTRRGWARRVTLTKMADVTLSNLYQALGVDRQDQVLIMTYTQDQASALRGKFKVGKEYPEQSLVEGGATNVAVRSMGEMNASLRTIGEAQGADAFNVVLLREDPKALTLYSNADQSIVGLTRFKLRFLSLSIVTSNKSYVDMVLDDKFPALRFEDIRALITDFRGRDLFEEDKEYGEE